VRGPQETSPVACGIQPESAVEKSGALFCVSVDIGNALPICLPRLPWTAMDTTTVHLTVEQAAAQAGVSMKTVRRMIRSGELVPGRAGQAYVIEMAALTAALAARRERLSNGLQPVQSSAPGLSSLSSPEALRDLVQQAVHAELAPLLDRLDRLQVERDQLTDRIRALEAPKPDSPEIATGSDSEGPCRRADPDVIRNAAGPALVGLLA
jgi:excisionase family DNA binding protein